MGDEELAQFYKAWKWKREHLPDRERFKRPYKHELVLPGSRQTMTLVLKQAKFTAEGFASTIWDSSIVMAKYMERHAPRYRGLRCLDLSAGCGLVGITLARLGASVVSTDLPPNIPLLRENCQQNAPQISVLPYVWGQDPAPLQPPFDVIVACDVMYVADAVDALISSLCALCRPSPQQTARESAPALHGTTQATAPASEAHRVQGRDRGCLPSASINDSCATARRSRHKTGQQQQGDHTEHTGGVPAKAEGTVAAVQRQQRQQQQQREQQSFQQGPESGAGRRKRRKTQGGIRWGAAAGDAAAAAPAAVEPGTDSGKEAAAACGGELAGGGVSEGAGEADHHLDHHQHQQRQQQYNSSHPEGATEVLIAHGRNRTAEGLFLEKASHYFSITQVPEEEQHPDFHCSDVVVYRLRPRKSRL